MNNNGIRVDIRLYSIFDIYNMIKMNKIDISPDYVRYYRWPDESKLSLIESIMTGIPISAIYVQEHEQGFYRLIDGVQRLNTIVDFLENKFCITDENDRQLYYSALSVIEQRKIQDYKLVFYVIKAQAEELAALSAAVNTSTMSVTPQEKRNFLYYKQGIPFIRKLAQKNAFQKLINGKDVSLAKMEDEELVLRFLSFYYKGYECYQGQMRQFLDDTLENYSLYEMREEETEKMFVSACELIYEVWGDNAFVINGNSRRRVNVALYDVIMYSFVTFEHQKIKNEKNKIKKCLNILLESDRNFRMSILGKSTTSKESVATRFEMWKNEMNIICN